MPIMLKPIIPNLLTVCLVWCASHPIGFSAPAAGPREDLLKKARENAFNAQSFEHQMQSLELQKRELRAEEDMVISGTLSRTQNTLEPLIPSSQGGTLTERDTWQTQISKRWSTGTQLQIGFTESFDQWEIEAPGPGTTDINKGSFLIELRQDLWRDFWGRQKTLQEKVIQTESIDLKMRYGLDMQTAQAEVDAALLDLIFIEKRKKILLRRATILQKLLKEIDQEIKNGFSKDIERVEVENIEVQNQETLALLEAEKEERVTEIENQTMESFAFDPTKFSLDIFEFPPSTLPKEQKINQRLDILFIQDKKENLRWKKKLSDEIGKPKWELFARQTKQAESSFESLSKNGENLEFGIQVQHTLGNTAGSVMLAEAHVLEAELERRLREVTHQAEHELKLIAIQRKASDQVLKLLRTTQANHQRKADLTGQDISRLKARSSARTRRELELTTLEDRILEEQLKKQTLTLKEAVVLQLYPRGNI